MYLSHAILSFSLTNYNILKSSKRNVLGSLQSKLPMIMMTQQQSPSPLKTNTKMLELENRKILHQSSNLSRLLYRRTMICLMLEY